jgi:hypothetical protein
MRARDHIRGPIRAHHQEPRGRAAAGEHGQQIDRRRIAPMQVFEPQDERRLGGQRLERLGQLPPHPLRGSAMAPAAQYVQLGLLDERGHLDEPGGCLPAQERDERSPLRPAREPAEGLEQRQVGLARAMVLDTLSAPDPQVLRPHDLRKKGVEEGGLADPGLPRDKHHLAFTPARALQGPVQLRQVLLPAYEAGGRLQGRRAA